MYSKFLKRKKNKNTHFKRYKEENNIKKKLKINKKKYIYVLRKLMKLVSKELMLENENGRRCEIK